ncbi:hypothetical protein PV10_06362 [Exophiala mesophila]|uniref:SEC7 domain-containing protein n=1 Tax=Exophiala mesophila TaxID=212818 RepID=A0A0D1XUI6_EXOME|nr:uncharacterized protein PV10_06362 [Exophiala mesophila]KIV91871.1 hypothetical protein PV10_06362 [Exophiala mesophila]
MPLKALLSSLPSTDKRHRRHSSIIENVIRPSDASLPATTTSTTRTRGDSFKRLSLGLSHTNEETFPRFLTHASDDMTSPEPSSTHDPKPVASEPVLPILPALEKPLDKLPEQPSLAPPNDLPLPNPKRFSLLGFRHASDSQLSTRFRKDKSVTPEHVAAPPTIITTAPTLSEADDPLVRITKRKLFPRGSSPFRKGEVLSHPPSEPLSGGEGKVDHPQSAVSRQRFSQETTSFERLPRIKGVNGVQGPPPYGDETSSSLAIPVTRLSDSSRSDDSSGDHVYAKTTTTHTISTTTTFFKLKRRKKDKGPLFPLPEKFSAPPSGRTSTSHISADTSRGRRSFSPSRKPGSAIRFDTEPSRQDSAQPSPTHSALALTNAPFGAPGPTIVRQDSQWSNHSGQSSPSVTLVPPRLGARGRSSTMNSMGRSAERLLDTLPQSSSARTSTSTSGRRSFGDLLSLPQRLRQNSAPPARHGATNSPSTPGSKSNSLHIHREAGPEREYPRREDGDTPASYLEKLAAAVPRGAMASILCKNADDFCKTCLRKYMRGFSYFGDSIDMAIRKMLMEVELPKETQQIDRLLAGFADRYYECNPGIFASPDETSYVAFSILLLHSDAHNKNNKRKMQKQDYVKNTQQGQIQIANDVLECFFDNICYTPFIHFEDEVAINSHRLSAPKPRKSLIKTKSIESLRGQIDPYTLLLDNKLDVLRPSLKDVMDAEDHYSSTGTLGALDTTEPTKAFLHSSVLQIVSARSRPDAFLSQATISNPGEAQAGLVSIKVAKVGLLWRKDPKKKKAKRPWQEWGAVLTDSKLYFFKDIGWVKKLMSQYDVHNKGNSKPGSLIFKPPLSSFEPDALMSMDDAVALLDSGYKKHKNAFVFIKHGGFEEVFLANSENEMNDWIGKLNYAATFRSAGVRMRGLLSQTYEGRHILRKNSDFSTKSGDTPAPTPQKEKKVDPQMAWEIMFYRRQLINEKISDLDEKIAVAQKELDQLLRNARHLLILLPIQQKTRETLVLAAGRMAAKLKWTRVELWRTRTHREILAKDLEQEGVTAFPAPKTSTTTTPVKTTPLKTSQHTLGRTVTDTSHLTLSPISATSSRPSNILEKPKSAENDGSRPVMEPSGTLDLAPTASPSAAVERLSRRGSTQDSHPLIHQTSVVESQHSRDTSRQTLATNEAEEQVLREAGLIGIDGAVPKDKRPETSESDRDRVARLSTAGEVSKGSSVRRLHRSLRDTHMPHAVHHHSPSLHRHRKARDSGSSVAATEDGGRSVSDAEELKRGTGSFILHGKKASVITVSSDWQNMSVEERLRLRASTSGEGKPDTIPDDEETVGENGSILSRGTEDETGRESVALSSRKPSVATTTGEHFVDAETGEPEEEDIDGEDNMEHEITPTQEFKTDKA